MTEARSFPRQVRLLTKGADFDIRLHYPGKLEEEP